MTMLLLLACVSPQGPSAVTPATGERVGIDTSDSATDSGGETAEDTAQDTAEDTAEPDPWDDPAFWSSPSDLDPFLDLSLAPVQAHFEVRVVEADATWTTFSAHTTIAHSISSLDLLVVDGGVVLLGGVNPLVLPDPEVLGLSRLFALVSADGDTYATAIIEVTDPVSRRFTDPALFTTDDGTVRAVYYSTPETAQGDPVLIPGDHEIRVAEREGASFRELPDLVVAAEGLVDPVICRGDDGWHVLATGEGGIFHATGPTPDAFVVDEDFEWTGHQVPFCSHVDGRLTAMVQGGGGAGSPMVREVDEAGTFLDAEELWQEDGSGNPFGEDDCTSPVRGTLNGRNLLYCAVLVGG